MNRLEFIIAFAVFFAGGAVADGSAFTAYLSATTRVGRTAIIAFEDVRMNQGENYDPMTGIYTCPADGRLAVSIGLTASNSTDLSVCLYNNGALETHMKLTQVNVLYSGVVMVHCAHGDHLYARVCPGSPGGKLLGTHLSFFSAQFIETNMYSAPAPRERVLVERRAPPQQSVVAYLSNRMRVSAIKKLVFDNTHSGLDIGESFDNTSGTFTCLYSGLYEFSLTLSTSFSSSSSSCYLTTQIRHNEDAVLELKTAPSYPSHSGTVLTSCRPGDDVYPYISAMSSTSYYGTPYVENNKRSLFTARLVTLY